MAQGPIGVSPEAAVEVILSYHADFDRAMRQDVAIGMLTIAGAFSAPRGARDTLLLRVGAEMCGMIRDDVYLETFSAKMRLLASAGYANELRNFVHDDDLVARYVLARWHDAAARAWYRIGNHTRALTEAQAALSLIEPSPTLWWCWADVRSNQLRMQQEADKQVRKAPSVTERDYDWAIDRAANLRSAPAVESSRVRNIEHLRGLWNLHHNRMVIRGPARLAQTLPEFDSIRERLVAEVDEKEHPDPYREAQTLNQEAMQLKEQALKNGDPRLFQRAISCFERLSLMPWPRGQYFASQHLPHLRAERNKQDKEERARSTQAILDLCKEAHEGRSAPGAREGFDLDRYAFTVEVARQIAGKDETALEEHELAVSRAIQSVASVSAYKRAAQRHVMPSLQRAAERRLVQAGLEADRRHQASLVDDAIALVEEGSARELLDLLSTYRGTAAGQKPDDVFVAVPGLDPAGLDGGGTAGRHRRASVVPDQLVGIVDAVDKQREGEEEYWLRNPIATQDVDPEISHYCRQFTVERFAADGGPVLIRYFQCTVRDYWAVAYFMGEMFGPFPLLRRLEENETIAALLAADGQSEPREFECAEIWKVFLEPVLSRIFPDKHTPQLGRLVIVPCGELFSIPLHVAAVPGDWRGEAVDRQIPLCHWKPVSFSVSLASHVLRNRAAFRSCVHQPGDDLCVLFAGEAGFRESIDGVLRSAGEWGAHGMARAPAGIEAVREVIARKPEFLVLQCHGSTLGHPQAGSVLMLHGGVLSNFGIASRQWLPRNKLTILGACVSGRPVRYGDVPADKSGNPAGDKPDDAVRPADEIAGFIRGFVAAGCGALLVTNWSVLQSELGDVTEKIVRRIGESKEVLHLDALLSEVFRSGGEAKTSFRRLVERSVFQVFL